MVNRAPDISSTRRAEAIHLSLRPHALPRSPHHPLHLCRRCCLQLSAQLTRIVGRADTVIRLSEELSHHRFVTVVGPGGIGKITVAVTVGHAQVAAFNGAVCFMDFGALRDPHLVASALASMLGLMVSSDDPVPGLLAFLQERRMLLILDSCEHVIESLAPLA